jgi:hypothetical protein
LLLPSTLLSEWSGIDVPQFRAVSATFRWNLKEDRASDYDRACDISDYVGVIPVGYGEGLVLNDNPCATAWLPTEWGGLLVRWEYAENDEAIQDALIRLPNTLAWEPKGTFHIVGSPQELFNSAEPGEEQVQPRLTLKMAEGMYSVRWVRHAPDASTAFGLIELRRVST